MKEGIVNKRKRSAYRSGDNNDVTESIEAIGSHKRLKKSPTLSETRQPPQVPKFQDFHLVLLKSLYTNVSEDFGSFEKTDDETDDDDKVDASVWPATRKFLKEREQLKQQKKEASHKRDLHEEAQSFMEEFADTPTKTPGSARRWGAASWNFSAEKNMFPITVSPQNPSLFSPLRSTGPSQQLSLSTPDTTKPAIKCFGVITTVLGRRYHNKLGSARRLSDPYNPLLEMAEAKISELDEKIKKLQQVRQSKQAAAMEDLLARPVILSSSSPPSVASDDPMAFYGKAERHILSSLESSSTSDAKLETKLKLWSMLACDLKKII